MAENNPDPNNLPKNSGVNSEKATVEPVRSRWTPKPEQILILESIFNSGMVNPPKDETVRIRKLLEKFGTVGDANVFYWFQNRRSRARRRQRQLQANLLQGGEPQATPPPPWHFYGGAVIYDPSLVSQSSTSSSSNSSGGGGFIFSSSLSSSPSSSNSPPSTASMSIAVPNAVAGTCCSSGMAVDDGADDLFSISRQMGFPAIREPLGFPTRSDHPDAKYHPGFITVFINGIPAEVPGGPFDTMAMFGSDAVLVRSSGEIVPVNEHGILFQGLEMGESYFLVPRLG